MRSILSLSSLLLSAVLVSPAFAALRPIEFAEAARPVSGAVVLPVGKDGLLTGLAQQIDEVANGAVGEAIRLAKFKGENDQSLVLYGVGPFEAVLLVGVGEAPRTAVDLRSFGAVAAKRHGRMADGRQGRGARWRRRRTRCG